MNENRLLNLNIKVSSAERARMHRQAARKGLTLSAYIRLLVLTDGKDK